MILCKKESNNSNNDFKEKILVFPIVIGCCDETLMKVVHKVRGGSILPPFYHDSHW